MNKITKQAGVLQVPDNISILYVSGDPSQAGILRSFHQIVDSAVAVAYGGEKSIRWIEVNDNKSDFGADEINLFRDCVLGMRNPFSDPEKKRIFLPGDNLIQELDLHTCFQPIHCVTGLKNSFKNPGDVNLFLFTGGTEYAHDYIEVEYAKVIKSSLRFATKKGLPNITIVHSENLSNSMEWAFKIWGYEIADKDFSNQTFSMNIYQSLYNLWGRKVADEELEKAQRTGKVIIRSQSIGDFLKGVSEHPEDYSVVVALKCCGDFISDELTKMLGAEGILPRAYYNYDNGHALFETVYMDFLKAKQHGLISFIPHLLSGFMLLDYIGWNRAISLIQDAFFKESHYDKQSSNEVAVWKQIVGSTVRRMLYDRK